MKYLAFRRVDITTEVDGYDCYHSHSADGTIAIPTEFILELTREEANELHSAYLLLPIVTKDEIAEALEKAKQEATIKAAKKAAKAEKDKATVAKRQATAAKKREQEEKRQLEKLQQKYGKV